MVALIVEHLEVCAARVLGQAQGLAQHVGERRRGTNADLDETLHAELPEQQVLSLYPAHGGSKLPGQKLDEQGAAQARRARHGTIEVRQNLRDGFRIHHRGDGFHELAAQREGPCHEVWNIAPHQRLKVDLLRDEGVKMRAEIRHAAH